MDAPQQDGEGQGRGKASFGATLMAVIWSFTGLRRRSDFERDAQTLNPLYVVIAGLVAVAVFIGLLILAVRVAVS
jgi:hypothetical protein